MPNAAASDPIAGNAPENIAPAACASPARAPEEKGWPLLGVAWHMRRAPLPFLLRCLERHGDAVYLKLGPYQGTLVRNPEHVKRVLVDNAANYTKQTRGFRKARIVLGNGLATAEGAAWHRQRRIATPAFHRHRIASFAPLMTAAGERMLGGWRDRTRGGRPLDVGREMMRVTLRIALEALMGVRAEHEVDALSAAVSEALTRTNDIITNPFAPPTWLPTPKNLRLKRAIATLERFVYQTIAARRAEAAANEPSDEPGDLLGMLIAARDEQTGEGLSDRQLRDEAVTILIAGHETTANALTWSLYLLGAHPAARDALETELRSVLAGRTPTFDDLPNLRYTRAVVEEAMRLYPPAWMISRLAMEADALGPYHIPARTFVLVSPYVTHRHPGLWDDPEKFDPTRFLDGRADALPRFAYLPFGGGPRFCIGANFALMEATLLLAMIAQVVRLDPLPDPPVEPWAMITLRPRHGMKAAARWIDG